MEDRLRLIFTLYIIVNLQPYGHSCIMKGVCKNRENWLIFLISVRLYAATRLPLYEIYWKFIWVFRKDVEKFKLD